MLKSELEEQNRILNSEFATANSLIREMRKSISDLETDVKGWKEQCDTKTKQLERISQSIYTLLEVKYPQRDIEPGALNTYVLPEEQNMLEFLHGLCSLHGTNGCDDILADYRHRNYTG